MSGRRVAAFLMGAVLAVSSVGVFVLRPAEAVSPASLPRDTQRIIGLLLRGASPYVQQLSVNAIQAIPPNRAQTLANNLRGFFGSYPDAQIVQLGQQYDFAIQIVLRFLPQNTHQQYINGLWGVSDAEDQFVQRVNQQVVQILQSGSGGGPGVGSGIDPRVFQQGQHDLQCGWLPNLPSCLPYYPR